MPNDGCQAAGAAVRLEDTRPKPLRQRSVGRHKRGWSCAGLSLRELLRTNLAVDPGTGCHVWTGPPTTTGYARVTIAAHRLAWELTHGSIPDGMSVLHRCDSPACCNPDHLFLGTRGENNADKAAKGRSRNRYTTKTMPLRASWRQSLQLQTDGDKACQTTVPATLLRRATGVRS